MQFKKTDLQEMLWGDSESLKIVDDKIIDTSRWAILHTVIFSAETPEGPPRYYRSSYSVGATEMQDEGPWDIEGDLVTVTEVTPKTVSAIEWVKVVPHAHGIAKTQGAIRAPEPAPVVLTNKPQAKAKTSVVVV